MAAHKSAMLRNKKAAFYDWRGFGMRLLHPGLDTRPSFVSLGIYSVPQAGCGCQR